MGACLKGAGTLPTCPAMPSRMASPLAAAACELLLKHCRLVPRCCPATPTSAAAQSRRACRLVSLPSASCRVLPLNSMCQGTLRALGLMMSDRQGVAEMASLAARELAAGALKTPPGNVGAACSNGKAQRPAMASMQRSGGEGWQPDGALVSASPPARAPAQAGPDAEKGQAAAFAVVL